MSDLRYLDEERVSYRDRGELYDRSHPMHWKESSGVSSGWMLVGVAALAVCTLALYHFGSDFKRYLKIKSM